MTHDERRKRRYAAVRMFKEGSSVTDIAFLLKLSEAYVRTLTTAASVHPRTLKPRNK